MGVATQMIALATGEHRICKVVTFEIPKDWVRLCAMILVCCNLERVRNRSSLVSIVGF
jgi:hypothetical protein